jgi:hypothetical protein
VLTRRLFVYLVPDGLKPPQDHGRRVLQGAGVLERALGDSRKKSPLISTSLSLPSRTYQAGHHQLPAWRLVLSVHVALLEVGCPCGPVGKLPQNPPYYTLDRDDEEP